MKQPTSPLNKEVYERVKKYKQLVASDPYRLHYHVMPPVGLLNDPNGFVQFNGKYHIFYQWNPFETAHGKKFWGHYLSDDLVHWEEAPIALAPDSWYDKNGCYSGSAIVHKEKLYLFYTGNVKDEQGNRESHQCLAVSEDGINFDKKGPIIDVPEGFTAHFRDPKVFHYNHNWYMVIGAQTVEERGAVVIYVSQDLENWKFQGTLIGSGEKGIECFGYMWECPDLLQVNGQDILLVCPQGLEPKGYDYQNIFQSGYFAGSVDLQKNSFAHGEFKELDRGFDFYAAQTTTDNKGRQLLFAWMGNAEEGGAIQPTVKHEWIHALTLPRELEWKDGKLLQHPVEELKKLRENEINQDVVLENEKHVTLAGIEGEVYELLFDNINWDAKRFSIQIGKSTFIHYDESSQTITLERKAYKATGDMEQRHVRVDKIRSLQLFKDTSSIELFVNDGEAVFTARVFDHGSKQIAFHVDGQIKFNVSKWNLKRTTSY